VHHLANQAQDLLDAA
jgi:hypothetical protein